MRPTLLLLIALLPGLAAAQTLKVLTAGAIKPLVLSVAPAFEGRNGVKVDVHNDTAGKLLERIRGGEAFDVVILTDAGARSAAAAGLALQPQALARVGIGLAVKAGAPVPPLGTADDFKQAVLGARKLAMIDPKAGGSSGIYLSGLFQKMGIAEAVAAKAVLVPGGLTATRLTSGEADLAVQQASELAIVDGVVLVGMLPPEIQNYTTYDSALGPQSVAGGAAERFAHALARAVAEGTVQHIGILPPAGAAAPAR